MKIALAEWNKKISPVFDSTRAVLLVDIENGTVETKQYIQLQSQMPYNRAQELVEYGVKVLICGAISKMYANSIETQDIKIIPFVTGNVDQVIKSYLQGKLNRKNFRMPGCGRRCRKHNRGNQP